MKALTLFFLGLAVASGMLTLWALVMNIAYPRGIKGASIGLGFALITYLAASAAHRSEKKSLWK